MSLKYLTCEKLKINSIRCVSYFCDDMSKKSSEKTYSTASNKDKNKTKDHQQFGYLQLYYNKNPLLYVTTPVMKCLFGVQKYNNNFQMSLQFTNLQEDNEMKQFFEFIQNTEFECMKYLGLDENDSDRFVSQIKYDKQQKYDPNLSIKIPFKYNQFQTDIYSEHSSAVNLFHIQGFTPMQCDIYLDKIWKMNDKFYAKWKCKIIHLV
jgi:hypothetical protein